MLVLVVLAFLFMASFLGAIRAFIQEDDTKAHPLTVVTSVIFAVLFWQALSRLT